VHLELNALATNATKENNNAVIRDTRKKSYGDIGDQLDEIYKDIDAWKARIKKIKDDNPKE
jgi:L-rhamnose isomerase